MSHKRFFIETAFRGSAYHGWQIQKNALSVQEVLEKALSTILRQQVETVGCGRTDTGVHARQLFAHFDLPNSAGNIDAVNFLHRLNSLLPNDIAAKRLIPVEPDAHARFDAVKRSYEYHTHFCKDPFLQDFSWQLREEPDVEAMNEAAKILLSYEDFSCFSKSHTQVFTNICHISYAVWERPDDGRLIFHISADRFLRNMVRAIVGTLLEIGNGKEHPNYMHTVIASKKRSMAGVSVPAHGLYLTEVCYPYL